MRIEKIKEITSNIYKQTHVKATYTNRAVFKTNTKTVRVKKIQAASFVHMNTYEIN